MNDLERLSAFISTVVAPEEATKAQLRQVSIVSDATAGSVNITVGDGSTPVPAYYTKHYKPFNGDEAWALYQDGYYWVLFQRNAATEPAFHIYDKDIGTGYEVQMDFTSARLSSSGTQGLRIGRTDYGSPVGLMFMHGGVSTANRTWDVGLDYATKDFVFAYDHSKPGDVFRASQKADDPNGIGAKFVLGKSVGLPSVEQADLTIYGAQFASLHLKPYFVAGVEETWDPVALWILQKHDKPAILIQPFDPGDGSGPQSRHTHIDFGDGLTFRIGVDRTKTFLNDFFIQDITNNLYRFIITPGGSVVIGDDIGNPTTAGYLNIPSCNGAPTGTPEITNGSVPMVFDYTNNRIYIYRASLGGWRYVPLL